MAWRDRTVLTTERFLIWSDKYVALTLWIFLKQTWLTQLFVLFLVVKKKGGLVGKCIQLMFAEQCFYCK